MSLRSALVILVVVLVPLACGRHQSPSVVVITLDTTRADRLSPYGFMNVTLPNIERIAREGVVFDQAASVAPLTLPAHASLFTGLLPPHHGVRENADPPLADLHLTLAEILRARGFRTAAFVGSSIVDPDRGLQQGFDEYAPAGSRQRRGDAVVDDAIRWLDRTGPAPFLMWVHLYDPHRPYDPPEPFGSTYAHNPYVGEIAFADAQIGRLLAALGRQGALDRAVLVIAGDHGESLGEHGERDHGVLLYENVLRVPLVIRASGLAATRIAELVRLTDVMPTILELAGVPRPPTDGVSLVPLMRGRARSLDLDAYAESLYGERFEQGSGRAIRVRQYKFIERPAPELYDLAVDPFEATNIYDGHRALGRALAARIAAIGGIRGADRSGDLPIPADLRQRLGALGYLGGGQPRAPR